MCKPRQVTLQARHAAWLRLGMLLALTGLWLGCTSREVPAQYPQGSPASPVAEPGAAHQVTLALEADPPLPGENLQGWKGLAPRSSEPVEDHHHHHHHSGQATKAANPESAGEGKPMESAPSKDEGQHDH